MREKEKEPGLAKRIYVGSLPYSATEAQLENLFGQYGQINEIYIVTDRYTGQAKGFAFVEMTNDNEAQRAIDELNGSEMGGRTLVVNEARERESGGGRFGGGGGGGGRRSGGGDRGSRRW